MAENAFLRAIEEYLERTALSPAPSTIGLAEPAAASALPAITLSLESTERRGGGLGAQSETRKDRLPWQASVDLANPVLPEEPSFRLLSENRRSLILPHGGLVRSDGSVGPLGSADLTVRVRGTPYSVVPGTPTANQVSANGEIGLLQFGAPLPATGQVVADYFLGQWERKVIALRGVLGVEVRDTTAERVRSLSEGVVDALVDDRARREINRLHRLDIRELGPIRSVGPGTTGSRARTLRFGFRFEQSIDRPESSGGVIHRISALTRVPRDDLEFEEESTTVEASRTER